MTPEQHNQFLYFFSTVPQFLAAFLGLSTIFFFFVRNKNDKRIFWITTKLLEIHDNIPIILEFTKSRAQIRMFLELKSITGIRFELEKIKANEIVKEKRDGEETEDRKTNFTKHLNQILKGVEIQKTHKFRISIALISGILSSLFSILIILFLNILSTKWAFFISFIILFVTFISIYFIFRIIRGSMVND